MNSDVLSQETTLEKWNVDTLAFSKVLLVHFNRASFSVEATQCGRWLYAGVCLSEGGVAP